MNKALIVLQLSENELKKVQSDMENTKHTLTQKEKQLETARGNVEQISNNSKKANEEITVLKNKLKGNMSLIQGRQLIWDEIISEVKNIWEHMTLVAEQKIAIKDLQFSILSTKEEEGKNVETAEKFIKYLNENPASELRTMDIVHRAGPSLKFPK